MKRFLILSTLFLFGFTLASSVKAQSLDANYRTAIGLRAGGTSGITFKHFTSNSRAFEGILGIWGNGFGITGLIEQYAGTTVPGLNWYYGAGAHIAVWDGPYRRYRGDYLYYNYNNDGLALGVDGIVGIEYKIPPIPFAVSLDVKPLLGIHTRGGAHFALDPGLGIKFAF